MSGDPAQEDFVLELYVQGQSPQSTAALKTVTRVCEERLRGRYSLVVIDILQDPQRIRSADLLAAPALIRLRPSPQARAVGRLTEDRVLQTLGLDSQPSAEAADEQ